MFQKKYKPMGPSDNQEWEPITDAEALAFAGQNYRDADAALSSAMDGCELASSFAWVRWIDD